MTHTRTHLLVPFLAAASAAAVVVGAASSPATPQIDLGALGSVGVIGSFGGLELFDPRTSLVVPPSSANTSSSSSHPSYLLSIDSQGHVAKVVSNAIEERILAVTECGGKGDIYIGGQFSSAGAGRGGGGGGRGQGPDGLSNIAIIHASNQSITALAQGGLDGTVSALLCDGDKLHVGGSFKGPLVKPSSPSPSTFAGRVATWDLTSLSWSPLPFGGFAGHNVNVKSITKSHTGSGASLRPSLLFGGEFETFWLDGASSQSPSPSQSPSNVTLQTLTNGTLAISASNGTSPRSASNDTVQVFPSLGSSLVPISLASAEITASTPTSLDSLFEDPTVVFCPAGEDGAAGSTWIGEEESTGRITARLYTPLEVGGFRLGNTFVDGNGAETFSITAIPSNEVLTLQYRDDPTAASSTLSTCTSSCPLRHDSSIPYEDFIIVSSNGTTTITGFELTLNTYYGSAPGLHLLQLLSSGSVSYSIDGQNLGYGLGVCSSGPAAVHGRSSSTYQSTPETPWNHHTVASSTVSGTEEGMVCAPTLVGTDPGRANTATWYPYIAQDGTYQLFFFTPACAFDYTCGQRGNVDVTVTITSGQNNAVSTTTTTTVDQEVTLDTYSLVYSGPINPVSSNDQVTVVMSMSANQPTLGPDMGDKYYFIADKVTVVATSTDGSGSNLVKIGQGMNAVDLTNANRPPSSSLPYVTGRGLWEYVEGPSTEVVSPTLDTTTAVTQRINSNAGITPLNSLTQHFSASSEISKVIQTPDGAFTLLAGNFNYSSSGFRAQSLVMVESGTNRVKTPNGGVAGSVSDMAVLDGWLYVVGDFDTSADASVTGLKGRARTQYSSPSPTWQPVPGLNDAVRPQTVSVLGSSLVFTFTGRQTSARIWSPSDLATVPSSSLVIGSFDAAAASASNASLVYLAGQISSLSQYTSNGMARLSADKGIQPVSFAFDLSASLAQPASSSTSTPTGSSVPSRRALSDSASSVISAVTNRFRKRQSSSSPMVPTTIPASALDASPAPQILAGAYWSASKGMTTTIVGGKFVSSDGSVRNIGLLSDQGTLAPLQGPNLSGTVRALQVTKDGLLWVGGSFQIGSGGVSNLAVYDLAHSKWMDSLQGSPTVSSSSSSGGQAIVYDIQKVGDGKVVVAGHFDAHTTCKNICGWDMKENAWRPYGDGLDGVVAAVAVMESSLFAAGSFVINNTSVYVASWSYSSSTWTALPSDNIPGPVTSIAVDTASRIFISGTAASSSAAFVLRFDGHGWLDCTASSASASTTASPSDDAMSSLVMSSSSVTQVALVPLADPATSSKDVFSSDDRALLVSGLLDLAGVGMVSSAIYDGNAWYPYLLSSSLTGRGAGTIARLFYSNSTIAFHRKHHLAVAVVVLISMAIALGIVFLGVLISLVIVLNTRREDPQLYPLVIPAFETKEAAKPSSPTPFLSNYDEKSGGGGDHAAKMGGNSMLETLNAATAGALSAGHPAGRFSPGVGAGLGAFAVGAAHGGEDHSDRESDASSSRPRSSSDHDGSVYDADDVEEGDDSLPLRGVRYSFAAEREEELSIHSSDMVEILDESDEHWHIVRRMRDGRQGASPKLA